MRLILTCLNLNWGEAGDGKAQFRNLYSAILIMA